MLTVMFATHNGASVLPRTLDSLARQRPPSGGWRLIVVDSASTDATPEILRAAPRGLPITVLHEPLPGKNRALNRALDLAEGDVFVFCDDDVVAADDWLLRWRQAVEAHPDFAIFAGSTRPLWPGAPPAWDMPDDQVSIVFGVNGHMTEGPCSPLCVLGTNMAVRAELFAGGLRFDAGIGPDGARRNYPMGSETELAKRLAALGHRCWFAEGPKVGHIIRPHQMLTAAMLARGYRWGLGQAHMRLDHHYPPPLLERKNLLRATLYPLLMPLYPPREAWARQWEWAADQGYEDGWRALRSLPPRWARDGAGPRIAPRFRRQPQAG
jgi:glycosyltransferase involved in cell wall biosynthesis